MPKRIQRERSRGWRMPKGCVYVGRPTWFGNPFTGPGAVDRFRRWLEGRMSTREWCEKATHIRFGFSDRRIVRSMLQKLRGKDLACWCPLDKPCHADVLLELANTPETPNAAD